MWLIYIICVFVTAADGDANNEVQQLIEGYIQQTEQLRSSIHSLCVYVSTMCCVLCQKYIGIVAKFKL